MALSLSDRYRNLYRGLLFTTRVGLFTTLPGIAPAQQAIHPQQIPWIDRLVTTQASSRCILIEKETKVCQFELGFSKNDPSHAGLRFTWVVIPHSVLTLHAAVVDKGKPYFVDKTDVALLSGGFWTGQDESAEPDGLLIRDGKRISDFRAYRSKKTQRLEGGIIHERGGSRAISITPRALFQIDSAIYNALQSTPLLVEGEKVAVVDNANDNPSNRAAVGIDRDGDIILMVALAPNMEAVKQFTFAYLVSTLPGLPSPVVTALGMDGAYAPALYLRGVGWSGSPVAWTASALKFSEGKP